MARLIDRGWLPRGTGPGQYRRINAHRIVLGEIEILPGRHQARPTTTLPHAPHWRVARARRFLDEHFDDIGQRSTFDLRAEAAARA